MAANFVLRGGPVLSVATLQQNYDFGVSYWLELGGWDGPIILTCLQLAQDRRNWEEMSDANWDAIENILAFTIDRVLAAVPPPPP